MDMTFFNGHFLGGTETPGFWTKQRVYKVPGEWVKEGRTVITVRVIDHGWSGGMNGPASSMKWVNSENVPNLLSGDWSYHPGVTLKALGLGPLTNPNDQPKVAEPTVSVEPPEPALLHPLNKPSDAVSAFAEGFALQEDATIVILGGSNAAETQRFGYLETLLAAAHPERRLIVRNMAWPADTVFNQQRPRNFFAATKPSYGEKDRRIKTAVGVAVLWLGQAEALGQSEQVEEFASAYEETLEQIGLYTERIVVVTPVPFEDPLGLGLDLQARNVNLGKHAATIRRLAKKPRFANSRFVSGLEWQEGNLRRATPFPKWSLAGGTGLCQAIGLCRTCRKDQTCLVRWPSTGRRGRASFGDSGQGRHVAPVLGAAELGLPLWKPSNPTEQSEPYRPRLPLVSRGNPDHPLQARRSGPGHLRSSSQTMNGFLSIF